MGRISAVENGEYPNYVDDFNGSNYINGWNFFNSDLQTKKYRIDVDVESGG